ncbi:MAG: RluA family pseudouridine synthase [Bryobacteraceae bacterium]
MALPDEAAAKIQCNTAEGPDRSWRVETPARLELFLLSRLPNASRDSIRRALAAGACRVDTAVRPWGFRLVPGAVVTLDAAARISEVRPESIPLDILYEDDELIAIDKPSGMLVHPTSRERAGTVANALRGLGFLDVHFLHRLDRDTSGVLLAAKTLPRHSPLACMFQSRDVEKRYLAVVAGPVPWEEQVVTLPIGRDPVRRPQWNLLPGGTPAETRLRVLFRGVQTVLLEAEPVTGRTNQIRIHCAAIGHPIIGDTAYGGPAGPRLLLHAWTLSFPTLRSGRCLVTAPPPPEFPRFDPNS